jgi:hypothetical protein
MKIIRLFAVLIIIQSLVFATGGSIYTRLGLGEFHYNFSARRFGFGGLGYSIADKDYLSYSNPAGWNQLEATRFETGYLIDAGNRQDKSNSVFNSNSYFNGMMFGFPISKLYGISFVAGIIPYSNVNYEVIEKQDSAFVEAHTINYTGSGGISRSFFGTSYKLPFEASVGASFDYYNGEIKNATSVTFGSSSTFNSFDNTRDISYHGVGFSAGIISNDLSKYLGIDLIKDLRLGISYSSKVTLSADSANVYTTTIGSYEGTSGSLKANLPARVGLGASFKLDDNYLFSLDYMEQAMSDFSWDGKKALYLQDVSKFSFGIEYRPSINEPGFWRQVMLRAGFSYEKTPYKISGYSINQVSLNGGFSLPLSYGNTIDLGFQYAVRGTLDNNLVKEKIYRFNIAISIGEFWFIQTER